MLNNDYNKLLNQITDILVYDYQNKFTILKNKGLDIHTIEKYMNEYQKIRIDEYKKDINNLNKIYK